MQIEKIIPLGIILLAVIIISCFVRDLSLSYNPKLIVDEINRDEKKILFSRITLNEDDSTSCADSTGRVDVGGENFRTCKWIAKRAPGKCSISEEVARYCPTTCNACSELCLDASGIFEIFGNNVQCADAEGENKSVICNIKEFANNCPKICGKCENDPSRELTHFPSYTPTRNPTPGEPTYAPSSPPSKFPTFSSTTNWVSVGSSIYGGTGGRIGLAISMCKDGQTFFVGEPGTGLVRPFAINDETSIPKGSAIGNAYDPWFGSSVASSRDGSVVVVGSYKYDNYRGLVRVFVWDGNIWLKLGNDLYGADEGHWFGWDVDISESGTTIVVGVNCDDLSHGHVRIYDIESSGWIQRGGDILGDETSSLGFSVVISNNGDTVATSAQKGSYVEVYEWVLDSWSLLGQRIEIHEGDSFGSTIALSSKEGLKLAIGTPYENSGTGAVYVYEWKENKSKWKLRGNKAAIRGGNQNDYLGGRVSISEDGDTVAFDSQTAVGVLVWNGSAWTKRGKSLAGGPASVSLSGDGKMLAVGLPYDNTFDLHSGTTVIFRLQ